MRKTVRELSSNQLEAWLGQLCGSTEGTIKLINLFLSRNRKLVKKNALRSFLADCVSLGAKAVDDALAHFDRICERDDTYFALSRAKPSSINGTSTLVTTISSRSFHQHILGRPTTRVKSVLPLEPKSRTDVDEKAYRDALERVTSRKDWYKVTSTLGKPFPDPKHVWFTDVSSLEAQLRAGPSTVTEATRIRDALGLIDTRDKTYLMSLEFLAAHLHAIIDLKMARPAFSDQGNKRFAVYLNKAAESAYRDNWGLTVHLGKLKAKPQETINGVPERICSPIALSRIGHAITVKPFGWVVGNRGEEAGVDDDGVFIDRLRRRRTLEGIKRQLLTIANKP